jgi:hypothetical protein
MPALSRVGDPSLGKFQDAIIATKFGDVGLYPATP